jgi:clan AA aspartic protease (TIGR02281 family)
MEAARSSAALGGDVEAIKGDLLRHPSDIPSGVLPLCQFGLWGVYKGSRDGKKVCFAQSKPFTSENNPPNRNPVYMLISTRPAEKVINEIRLKIGYQFKAGSEATAQIGGSTFRLLTHRDAAWAKSLNEQAKMIHAMRDADSVVIKGVSAKGTWSIDTFTLQGFGDAVDRAYQECIATEPQESAAHYGQQSNKFIVQLKDDGGVFVVPVEINSAITLDFVIDSGASDVTVPADVVSTLIRTHTIEASDFVGKQAYVLADGSEAPSTVFIIRSLKIGNHLIENVRGAIAPAKGELLLGQSFLQKFRSWSIDNTKHALILE